MAANHFPVNNAHYCSDFVSWFGERPGAQRVIDTALAWAVLNSHFEVADFLLAHGADINTNWCSHEPASMLHELVWYKNYQAMQFLIDRGIDMTIRDYRWDSTAQGWAYYAAKDEKMAQWLGEAQRRREQAARRDISGPGMPGPYNEYMRCGVLRVDRVVVNKARREMLLLSGESVVRSYRVALGREPAGHKQREGDGRTPEGRYVIDRRNPRSKYHLSLHISYPSAADSAQAREAGLDPGGDIMIHGLKPGVAHPETDWTQGCIAVTDAEMDEIWQLVSDGTAIEINP